MRTASARLVDSIGKSGRWVTEVLWSNDGKVWQPAQLVSGTITRSLSDQIHWSASLELAAVDASVAGINPYSTRVKVRHGRWFGPNDTELLQFGVFRVTETAYDKVAKTLSIDLSSFESFVIDSKFLKPARVNDGSADAVLRYVLTGVFGSSVSLFWDERIADKAVTAIPGSLVDQDRWNVVDGDDNSVAAAVAGRVIADESGGFKVIPVPTLQDDPVGEIKSGPGGLLISHESNQSLEDVANVVVATGSSVDGVTIGPVIIRDNDTTSVTYVNRPIVNGGFGQIPYFFTSSLITSETPLVDAAKAKLAQRLGLKQQVSWSGVHNPLIEPGDVLLVDGDRVILDAVTYDLTGQPLSAETRTQSANLLGQVWEDSTSDEDTDDSDEGEADD